MIYPRSHRLNRGGAGSSDSRAQTVSLVAGWLGVTLPGEDRKSLGRKCAG